MGTTSSVPLENGDVGEVDNSSGFHLIQVHIASVGGTLIFLIILALVAGCCVFAYFKLRKQAVSNIQAAASYRNPRYFQRAIKYEIPEGV